MKRTLLLVPFLMFVSCAMTQTQQDVGVSTQKQEINREVFGDIPVYPGFKLVYNKSFTYQSGSIKVGRLVFTGTASIVDVVNFYRKSLKELGWDLVSSYTYEKSAFMDFLSPDRSLQISLEKEFSGLKLVIQVGPRESSAKGSE